MSTSSCLASTGFDLLPVLFAGFILLVLGAIFRKSAQGRAVLLVCLLVASGALVLGSSSSASAACPPVTSTSTTTTSTPSTPSIAPTPAALSAQYLANSVTSDGYVLDYYSTQPSLSNTAQTVIALASTGDTSSLVTSAMTRGANYLASHIDSYVDDGATPSAINDSASALAELLLAAHVSNVSSLASQANSLETRLLATQQTSGPETGLFGYSDATFDGTIRQGISLKALVLAGVATSNTQLQSALTWLLAQQCSGGGFSSDLVNNPCSGLPSAYQGPDTNSTAFALVGIGAMGASSSNAVADALAYLQGIELPVAGWDWFGGGFDSNTTASVIAGLRSIGEDPSLATGAWSRIVSGVSTSPVMALAQFEVLTPGANQGGYLYQLSSIGPDIFSTNQSVTALSAMILPA